MENLRITVEGKVYEVVVERLDLEENDQPTPVAVRSAAPASRPAAAAAPAPKPAASAQAGETVSPLAGLVQAVEVTVGATVKEGDLILTLEAMKMYSPINATSSGTVKAIHVKPGDAVEEGQALCTIG